jgi:hypothetical protein
MELTVRRAAGLALAAFVLLVLARPPHPAGMPYDEQRTRGSSEVERARAAREATNDTLYRVEYALWARQLRDSVRRELARTPAAGLNRAFIDARVPASLRAHIERVYADTRAKMPAGRVALPVFVVLDTSTNYRPGTTHWIENAAGSAPACATVAHVRMSQDSRRIARDFRRVVTADFPQPRHFGLCGFEAAFGAPASDVRRWLEEREYHPVSSGYDPTRTSSVSRRLRDLVVPYLSYADNGILGLEMRACFAGRSERCLAAVAPTTNRTTIELDGVASNGRWYGWYWNGSPDLMNTLATSMGAASFEKLWRGDAPPPEAYRRLTGVPIDTVARRVLVGDAPPLGVGASLSIASVLTPLLIAAVFAGLATLAHPRRRKP